MFCILGASGRIGGFMRRAWEGRADVLWQGRGEAARAPGWLHWDPLAAPWPGPALPGGTFLVLAGVIRGDAAALAPNSALALAGIEAARRAGAQRVLLCSSAAVYGRPAPGELLSERRAPRPVSAYGAAKLAMERAVSERIAGVDVCILRIGNVLGADALIGGVKAGRVVTLDPVPGHDEGPLRSYIGPGALARVIDGLARVDTLPPVINIAAPGLTGMAGLLRAARADWAWGPANPDVLPEVGLDVSLLQSLLPGAAGSPVPEALVADWRSLGG